MGVHLYTEILKKAIFWLQNWGWTYTRQNTVSQIYTCFATPEMKEGQEPESSDTTNGNWYRMNEQYTVISVYPPCTNHDVIQTNDFPYCIVFWLR